jgi:hypothetical protein
VQCWNHGSVMAETRILHSRNPFGDYFTTFTFLHFRSKKSARSASLQYCSYAHNSKATLKYSFVVSRHTELNINYFINKYESVLIALIEEYINRYFGQRKQVISCTFPFTIPTNYWTVRSRTFISKIFIPHHRSNKIICIVDHMTLLIDHEAVYRIL